MCCLVSNRDTSTEEKERKKEKVELTMAEKTKQTANSTELVPLENPTAVHKPTTCHRDWLEKGTESTKRRRITGEKEREGRSR